MDVQEFLFQTLITYLQARAPDQWWISKGFSKTAALKSRSEVFLQIRELGLSFFYKNFQLKFLPQSLIEILYRWREESLKIELFDALISPEDLLLRQTRGERIVTFSVEKAIQGELVDGKRDSFEFMLHDLIHGSLFFDSTHKEQVSFFNSLLENLNKLEPMMSEDSIFKNEIEYVMSDMNSNPSHMKLSLKASLINYQKRKEGLLEAKNLSPLGELAWQNIFASFEATPEHLHKVP